MVLAFLKRNRLLLLTFAIYVVASIATVLVIDLNIYQAKKRELFLVRDPAELFSEEDNRELVFQRETWRHVFSTGKPTPQQLQALTESATRVVEGPSSVFRIVAQDANDNVLVDVKRSKFHRFNDFSNSLWLKSFEVRRGSQYSRTPGEPGAEGIDSKRSLGAFYFEHTTPKPINDADLKQAVEDLTAHYRVITIGIVGLMTLITAFFMRRVLIPQRNITSSIELSTPQKTRFVPRPRSRLELLYNGMARDAILMRLQERISERIDEDLPASGWDVLETAADYLLAQHPGAAIACAELYKENGDIKSTGRRFVKLGSRSRGKLKDADLTAQLTGASATGNGFRDSDGALQITRLESPESPGIGYAFGLSFGRRPAEIEAAKEFLTRLAPVLQRSLEALLERTRTLERERGRASMNLSRNLGHDLTNIIARSKLELMTLKTLLDNGSSSFDEPRQEILRETLTGLLDSTKFMQEVVNLYRSYAFLRKPIFETQDPNKLVEETVRLFQLSTSQKLRFEERLDPATPACGVDSRLMKLALFNLFSNALDAIRRNEKSGEAHGLISVITRASSEGGAEIIVQDSGTGILNESGERATPAEIERVFSLGFTLKAGDEGEGLGLNWVRTIVQDIHGGAIRAENAEEGGARFILSLPPAGARPADPPQSAATSSA